MATLRSMESEVQAVLSTIEVQQAARSRSASSSGSFDKSKLDDLPAFPARSRNVSQTASESFLSTSQALAPITEESTFTSESLSVSPRNAGDNSKPFSLTAEQLHTLNIAQMRLAARKHSMRKGKSKKKPQRGRSKNKRCDEDGGASSPTSKRGKAPTPVRVRERGRSGMDDLSADGGRFTDYGSTSDEQIWQIRKVSDGGSHGSSVLSMTMVPYFSAASSEPRSSTAESSLPAVFGLLPMWLRPDPADLYTSGDSSDVSEAPPPVWAEEVVVDAS